jgi:hypothetical protein
VLGVEEDPLAGLAQVGDRLLDHRQVFPLADLQHLCDLEGRAFPDQGTDPDVGALQDRQALVLLWPHPPPPGHPEGDDLGVAEPGPRELGKQLPLLRVGGRKSSLDQVDP